MQIELRVFCPTAATCEVCHSPSTPSIKNIYKSPYTTYIKRNEMKASLT